MKEENKLVITLKDGSKKEYVQPMSAYDIARDISDGLARVACMAEIREEGGKQIGNHTERRKQERVCTADVRL